MSQESLVSISKACQILGVSEATLRQWTDDGKIKAFITPGGHRRYSKVELKKFMSSREKVLSVKDLIGELEDTVCLHREIARNSLAHTSWYKALDEESQGQLAYLGRQLLSLIITYVSDPARREGTLRSAREVGRDFGETLAKLDLSLTDSVESFILHREPIMNVVTHMMKKKEAFSGRIINTIALVTRVMDEALVSLVAAHECINSLSVIDSGGHDAL